MKYASWDIEIAKTVPEGEDLHAHHPLGITCGAVALEDDEINYWYAHPKLTRDGALKMLSDLEKLVEDGYTLLTWNGTQFDFRVLAEETQEFERCAKLAMGHVDMMLQFTFTKGFYLSLEAALAGMRIPGKLKEVTLKDGTVLKGMSGVLAPELWAKGETDAVLSYLREDVTQPLRLAYEIEKRNGLRWITKRGMAMAVHFDRLRTVEECLEIPQPDTSWMDASPSRDSFFEWMP